MEGKPVKEVKKGDTTLVFYEDCCKLTTSKEQEEIRKELARIAMPALRAASIRKEGNA